MVRYGNGQLEVVGRILVTLAVIDHELADEPPARHEGDEGERADPLAMKQRAESLQRRFGVDVRDDHRLGRHRIGRPGRMPFDGPAVLDRQFPGGPKPHHPFVVVDEDGAALGPQRPREGVERRFEHLLDPLCRDHGFREVIELLRAGASRHVFSVEPAVLDGRRRPVGELFEQRQVVCGVGLPRAQSRGGDGAYHGSPRPQRYAGQSVGWKLLQERSVRRRRLTDDLSGIGGRDEHALTRLYDQAGDAFADRQRRRRHKALQHLAGFRYWVMDGAGVQAPVPFQERDAHAASQRVGELEDDVLQTRGKIQIGVDEGARGATEHTHACRRGVRRRPAVTFRFQQPQTLDRLTGVSGDQEEKVAVLVAGLLRFVDGQPQRAQGAAVRNER